MIDSLPMGSTCRLIPVPTPTSLATPSSPVWAGRRGRARWRANHRSAAGASPRYKGLLGQAVLSVQALYHGADRSLPSYQQPLLGGAGTVRGHRVAGLAGDNLALASVEVRVPLTSPMGLGQAGVICSSIRGPCTVGQTLRKTRFRQGAGVVFSCWRPCCSSTSTWPRISKARSALTSRRDSDFEKSKVHGRRSHTQPSTFDFRPSTVDYRRLTAVRSEMPAAASSRIVSSSSWIGVGSFGWET